jgi:magnesium chelatase family protein
MDQRKAYEQQLAPLLREVQRIAAEHSIPFLATFFDEQGRTVIGTVDHLLRNSAGAAQGRTTLPDLAEVRGQAHACRALEVAAAGGHNILLIGPRDAGKRFLASALPTLLPPCGSGSPPDAPQYPIRIPPAAIRPAAFLGGGRPARPGEVTLAHGGVLCLPDLHTFPAPILAALAKVVEERAVPLAQAGATTVFPANFLLVASVTPCSCGCYTDTVRACECRWWEIARHQKRLARTVDDCFDLSLEVPRHDFRQLARERPGEGSAPIRARVAAARLRQAERFKGTAVSTNAAIPPADIERWCSLDEPAQRLFDAALQQTSLTIRQAHRTLRVARTIADLWGSAGIGVNHVAEALQYRARWAL